MTHQITKPRDTSTPASREQISQALTLLTSLPRRPSDDERGKLNLEAYHTALAGVTRYALNLATQTILRGELGHGFYPSPAEYRQACERAMEPIYRQERAYRQWQQQQADRRASEAFERQQTPEARQRVKEAYEAYCARHESEREPEPEFDWLRVNTRFDAARNAEESVTVKE